MSAGWGGPGGPAEGKPLGWGRGGPGGREPGGGLLYMGPPGSGNI